MKKRTLWREELIDLIKQDAAVNRKRDAEFDQAILVKWRKMLAIDLAFQKRIDLVVHFDGHEPLADFHSSLRKRVGWGDL